jgi:dextranase
MTTPIDALIERADSRPGDDVVLLLRCAEAGSANVHITHLGTLVVDQTVAVAAGTNRVVLGPFSPGSYALTATIAAQRAHTAFDVLEDRNARPRYGFVTDFRPHRTDTAAVASSFRAFHITHVQFYDWMYRHAQLLPPADEFVDTLGRELSLAVVRDFVAATQRIGAQALAYAAVYAAGEEWAAQHPEQLVSHADGTPWMLGDFLWNTDISEGSAWSTHIVEEMGRAVEQIGFDGLHLDQYGDPKLATTASGHLLDLAEAFPVLIDTIRRRLPRSTLIFNNVNDFPTRTTVRAAQDATYIEVWSPHDSHADLMDLVRQTHALAPERPVILAAYLEPFADGCGDAEIAAATLALATTWAEGGQYLLFGENAGVLVHPYYPKYATLTDGALSVLRRFCDFAVANGDLLFDPELLESTGHLVAGINSDIEITGTPTANRPTPGAVWVRVSAQGRRLVLQLVDFRHQNADAWNAPRQTPQPLSGMKIRVRAGSRERRVRFGHPNGSPHLQDVPTSDDADMIAFEVPEFSTWGMCVIDR